MTANQPQAHEAFLLAFSGSTSQRDAEGGLSIALRGGRLNVIRDASCRPGLRLHSLSIGVPDIENVATGLMKADVPFALGDEGLGIAPQAALGVVLRFERGGTSR
jgi:hypothetical protein